MKILFLELSRESSPEYEVNHLLARHACLETPAPAGEFAITFITQGTAEILQGRPMVERWDGPVHYYHANFGRDLSIRPWPNKARRGWMMARRLPRALQTIRRVIDETKPDFIYTSQQRYDVLAARAIRRLTGLPHILHLYYQVSPALGRGVFDELWRTPYLLTCSEYNRDRAAEWGVPAKVAVCPNPVDAGQFDLPLSEKPANRAFVRQTYGFAPDAPVIVSVGRLDPEKHIDVTIRALAQALRQVPEARLLVCGASYLFPDYDKLLSTLVKELGLQKQVVFAGFVDDLPRILSGSDIYCLPSEGEVFSVAILEAMAAGLPVLSVLDGGTPEAVVHGETGLLGPLNDHARLAKHMVILLQNPDLAQQMGQAGRERVYALYTPQTLGPRWRRIVEGFAEVERQRKAG